jgi:hypothetical protein
MASFQPIPMTTAYAISTNDKVVVGTAVDGTAVEWTNGVLSPLLVPSGGSFDGQPLAVSADASVIVGVFNTGLLGVGGQAFRWTAKTGAVPLFDASRVPYSYASGVSADGSVVVGGMGTDFTMAQPFRWASGTATIIAPGALPSAGEFGIGRFNDLGVSADGKVVSGTIAAGLFQAFRWDGTLTYLSDQSTFQSTATAISPDGTAVIGKRSTTPNGGETGDFLWTSSGVTSIGPYQNGADSPNSASLGGTYVVGGQNDRLAAGSAFIWQESTGRQDLKTFLLQQDPGLATALSGWTLLTATAITPDGHTMIGDGEATAFGPNEQWIAQLDSSSPPPPPTSGGSVTSLQISTLSPVYSQSITLTATVSPALGANGTPTGSVTFADRSVNLGAARLNNGVAVLAVGSLPVGSDAITASYGGDSNFDPSTSPGVNVAVQRDGTSIVVTTSNNPAAIGAPVTFRAVVSAIAPGAGTPTGRVTFKDGATILGSGTLAGGMATFSTSSLPLGPHAVAAVYDSDPDFLGSTSAPLVQTISAVIHVTRTTLVGAPVVSSYGQKVKLTATVVGTTPFSGLPTGTVTFRDGLTVLGIVPLRNAQAVLTTTSLPSGINGITAIYSGDSSFSGSASLVWIETVGNVPTRIRATTSRRVSVLGHSVTFSTTVSAIGRIKTVPTGSVSFWDGFALLGTVDLTAGKASFKTSLLSAGTHSIRVTYNGQIGFSSSSTSVRQTVKQPKNSIAKIVSRLLG